MSGSTEKKCHLLGGRFLRSAFHDQLTARGANVAATTLAHRNRQMPVGQNHLLSVHYATHPEVYAAMALESFNASLKLVQKRAAYKAATDHTD